MPLLGFTKLLDKLLDKSKTQTIRKPRKHPIKEGDRLYIYWKLRTKHTHKLGEAIVTNVDQKWIVSITDEEWIRDGFVNGLQGERLFYEMHPGLGPTDKVDIIRFAWYDGPHPPERS